MTTFLNLWINISYNIDDILKIKSVSDVLNIDKNEICIMLKNKYPDMDDKLKQSYALAFLISLFLSVNE